MPDKAEFLSPLIPEIEAEDTQIQPAQALKDVQVWDKEAGKTLDIGEYLDDFEGGEIDVEVFFDYDEEADIVDERKNRDMKYVSHYRPSDFALDGRFEVVAGDEVRWRGRLDIGMHLYPDRMDFDPEGYGDLLEVGSDSGSLEIEWRDDEGEDYQGLREAVEETIQLASDYYEAVVDHKTSQKRSLKKAD